MSRYRASSALPSASDDAIMIVDQPRAGDADRPQLDAVRLQFLPADLDQHRRGDAVARQISVERVRAPIARLAEIAAPARAGGSGRASTRRSARPVRLRR